MKGRNNMMESYMYIEELELDKFLTFNKPMTKEDIMFESLSQEELHQLKFIDYKYEYKLRKIIKSGRSAYLLSIFGEGMEDEGSGFWEDTVGENGWRYLESLYCMGFLDKHLIVAMLDKDMIFDEALNVMAGDNYDMED